MDKKSNVNIGSVGRNMNVRGDIIGGDKITTSDRSITIINYGFKKEEDKAKFIYQMDELRSMMDQMKSQIDKIEGFDKNKREEIINNIMEQVESLKKAKEEAGGLKVGQEAPEEKAKNIEGRLEKAKNLMEELQKMGTKITGFGSKIVPIVSKALKILINVRTLFGVP